MLPYLPQFCKTFPVVSPPAWQGSGADERQRQGRRILRYRTPSLSRGSLAPQANSLPWWHVAGLTLIINCCTRLPRDSSQKLPHPAVRLAIYPALPSVAALIPGPIFLTLYIVWCRMPMTAYMFVGTKEASYA